MWEKKQPPLPGFRSTAVGSCVLDGNKPWCQLGAEETGLEEESVSGCNGVTRPHEALISREEVEQKGLQNLVP